MKPHSHLLLVVSVTFVWAAMPSRAAEQGNSREVTAIIDGTLVDSRGKAVQGARVDQFNSSGAHFAGGPSDQQGKFALRGRSPDATFRYRVTLTDGTGLKATPQQLKPLVLRVAVDPVRIQGIWQVTSSEDSGRKAPKESIRDFKVAITGNVVLMPFGDKGVQEHQYAIDPTKKPPAIDLTRNNDKTTRGIYELSGDTLPICLSETRQRPTAFVSEPESNNDVLIKLQRESPAESVKRLNNIQLPENQQARAKLLERIEIDFLHTPLAAAMDYLSSMHNVEIRIDKNIPQPAGRDPVISLQATQVTLHIALTLMLQPLGLAYEVKDGGILVKSAQGA